MSLNFCTIASGSSGNSAFISSEKTKILIDAGLSGRAIEAGLAANGINPRELTAIFITHEHGDHIKGAGVMSRRYNIPIYMTAGTAAQSG
ncbi:MAG: MBL fold metallo-hydrolase, partial [Defluviitaleaceae bacterium]|nr:MBL fold metallo-hydrolase [Defluviitaleaceae bacterium]